MCVMIAGNHHYRHLCTGNLVHREVQRLGADTVRIEQVTNNQEKVGTIAIRDIDYSREGAAHAMTEDIAPGTRTKGISVWVDAAGALEAPVNRIAIVTLVGRVSPFNRLRLVRRFIRRYFWN